MKCIICSMEDEFIEKLDDVSYVCLVCGTEYELVIKEELEELRK